MIILDLFDGVAITVFAFDSPLLTVVAATAITGNDLNAVEGSDAVALNASLVENFVALELAVDADEHLLQRIEIEAGQAIAENIVLESAGSANPMWLAQ